MADTVTLPAVGKVDQKWVIAGGALVAGLVGYAWWTRGAGFGAADEGEIIGYDSDGNAIYAGGEGDYDALGFPLQPGSTPDYRPPTIVDSNFTGEQPTGIDTNAEWTQAAIGVLITYGSSPVAVSSALGKYLDRQPLNPVEMDLVRQAIAAAGPPPQGGPYQLIEEQAGAATGPPDVAGLKASSTATAVTLTWDPSPGAAGWEVRRDGGGTARRSSPVHTSSGLKPNTSYTFRVRSFNTANQFGAEDVITAKTGVAPPKGSTPGTGTIGFPQNLRVSKVTRVSVTITWGAVPGAKTYLVTRQGGGRGVPRPGRVHTSSRLRPNTTYTFIVRAVDAAGRSGPSNVITARTRK